MSRLRLFTVLSALVLCTAGAWSAFAGWRASQDRVADRAAEQRLVNEFAAAHSSGRHAKAIEIGLQLTSMAPASAGHAYNLACAYAKANDVEHAGIWLQRAAERGFTFLATMQRDEDLAAIRESADYQAALKAVKASSDRELESFKNRHAGDEPIIILPPRHDASMPAPLIVALHPTGGKARDFSPVWRDAAARAGAILVVPEGKLAVGDGWRWGKVEHGEWQTLHAIEFAKSRHKVDLKRVVVTGFSEGGSVSFVVALRNPSAIAAAIPMCGEFVPEVSPVTKLTDGTTSPRIYIITGEHDRDVASNRLAEAQLKKAGWAVNLREFQGMGHTLPPNRDKQFATALEWAFESE